MIRTQVSFDAEMYDRARAEARRLGVSFAELCRRAVAQLLRQRPEENHPWMGLAGAIETGGPDASRSVDEVVYGRERP
jgi:hypothetical protein